MNLYDQISSNKRKSFLLVFLFGLVVLLLGWFFSRLTGYGDSGIVLAAIISVVMALFSYYQGDKMALWSSGAQPISKEQNAYLYRLVENLCITAGMTVPKIYLINDPMINAFATGRDPKHASIAVTTGAIEKLENEELEGVLAHELSHIKNYDIRLMMLVLVLVGVVSLLADWTMRSMWFGRGRRDNDEKNQLGAILMVVGLVLMILSPIIAQLIQLAVSRRREFLADSSGVLLTRYPEGLARALEKIAQLNQVPLRSANNATAHLYIANPFGKTKKFLGNAFSTHPPIEERIKALRAI